MMRMIKHASLFKWPQTNGGASKMTNSTDSVIGTSIGSNDNGTSSSSNNSNGNGKSKQHQQSSSSSSSSSLSSQQQQQQQQQQQSSSSSSTQQQKLWIHPPATLQNGHIAYLVKYFGNVEVNQPKGIDVVKESINKLKFIQPLKKSEGQKIPKVELTISVNGVAIQEPKTKKIYCQFPLHRISYCADDKNEKKFFSFIAKDSDTDKHLCFVFMSEKMSEEIILTIGQAFDLAYAKFIETSGRELEIRKQLIILQKKVCHLEEENKTLKERLRKYEPVSDSTIDIDDGHHSDNNNTKPSSLFSSSSSSSSSPLSSASSNNNKNEMNNGLDLLSDDIVNVTGNNKDSTMTNGHSMMNNKLKSTLNSVQVPPLQPPPSSSKNHRSNQQINLIDVDIECNDNTATLLNHDNLLSLNNSQSINDLFDEDFNPRAEDNKPINTNNNVPIVLANNLINNPIVVANNQNISPIDQNLLGVTISQEKDIFGCEPFHQIKKECDPFGMPQFNGSTDLDSAIDNIDKKLAEMRDGFSQGLSADGFNLDS
nr:PTB domain-containing adapter protein ced-6-like [Dermatophagoides farinae]